jgi:DNA-binding transcriptional MerR regulator
MISSFYHAMTGKHFRTSDLAAAAGVHPNTVRLYEHWGLLQPVERDPENNYRCFTQRHLDQILLVRSALGFNQISKHVRATAYEIIDAGAKDDLGGALERSYTLLSQIQFEITQAEAAANYLQRWADGGPTQTSRPPLQIGETAHLLDVSIDQLRNWERNGLLDVPRNPENGYRKYGAQEIGRLRVVRMLVRSRYSMNSILRMLFRLDQGDRGDLRAKLDTPEAEEDVLYVTDQWLTTLAEKEQAAHSLIRQIETLISDRQDLRTEYL